MGRLIGLTFEKKEPEKSKPGGKNTNGNHRQKAAGTQLKTGNP